MDLEKGLPLHFEIYQSRSGYYGRLFLTRRRQLGSKLRLIVTEHEPMEQALVRSITRAGETKFERRIFW